MGRCAPRSPAAAARVRRGRGMRAHAGPAAAGVRRECGRLRSHGRAGREAPALRSARALRPQHRGVRSELDGAADVAAVDPSCRAREARAAAASSHDAAESHATSCSRRSSSSIMQQESRGDRRRAARRRSAAGPAPRRSRAASTRRHRSSAGRASRCKRSATSRRRTADSSKRRSQAQIAAAQKALTRSRRPHVPGARSRSCNPRSRRSRSSSRATTPRSGSRCARSSHRSRSTTRRATTRRSSSPRSTARRPTRSPRSATAISRRSRRCRPQLHAQVQHDLNAQVARDPQPFAGALAARQQSLHAAGDGPVGGPVIADAHDQRHAQQQVNPNLPPALRARIEQLHDDYQKRFQRRREDDDRGLREDARRPLAALRAAARHR